MVLDLGFESTNCLAVARRTKQRPCHRVATVTTMTRIAVMRHEYKYYSNNQFTGDPDST